MARRPSTSASVRSFAGSDLAEQLLTVSLDDIDRFLRTLNSALDDMTLQLAKSSVPSVLGEGLTTRIRFETDCLRIYFQRLSAHYPSQEMTDALGRIHSHLRELWNMIRNIPLTPLARFRVQFRSSETQVVKMMEDKLQQLQICRERLGNEFALQQSSLLSNTQNILRNALAIGARDGQGGPGRDIREVIRGLRSQVSEENRAIHTRLQSTRVSGPGNWFLYSPEYLDWVHAPERTLFCPGIPGSGKSVLTSLVIDDIQAKLGLEANIAWFYFDFQNRHRQDIHQVVITLVILLCEQSNAIPEALLRYVEDMRRDKPVQMATTRDLRDILHAMGAPQERIFLLFDGIDEASDDVRAILIPELQDIQATIGLNIFVTSRISPEIADMFSGSTSLEVRVPDLDVLEYIKYRIQSDSRLSRLVTGDSGHRLEEEIVRTTARLAGGMFLYVHITLQSLSRMPSRRAILKALKDDTRVDFLYRDLISRVDTEPSHAGVVRRALPWLMFAKRPLSASEVRHALAVEDDNEKIDNDSLVDPNDIVSMSAGLFCVRNVNGIPVFQFSHWTALEYFRRESEGSTQDMCFEIALKCIAYISLPAFDNGPRESDAQFEQRLNSYPLYEYASKHWSSHFKEAPDGTARDQIDQLALSFLSQPQYVASSAQALMASPGQLGYSQVAPSEMTGIHLAAYLGLENMASVLLHKGSSPSAADSSGGTPLIWAARGGNTGIASLLLDACGHEADACINLSDQNGTTALSVAASQGYEELALMLLMHGANPNPWATNVRSPLIEASENGHESVVLTLLRHGANPNSFAEDGQSALHGAAASGHVSVVRVLLDHSADPRHRNEQGQTTIFAAATSGHAGTVEMLLEAGADPKQADNDGQTPLLQAVLNQHDAVIEVLLASAPGLGEEDGVSMLERAIEREGWAVIDVLLRHRDVAALPTGTPGRLVFQAAKKGKVSVMGRLIQRYPDAIGAVDESGRTPLSWAAQEGHSAVIEVLLGHGADINARDHEHKTPLACAIEAGQDEAAILLLQSPNADPNDTDSDSRTLLSLASQRGQTLVVRSLLERSDVALDAVDKTGRTALSWAIQYGHLETVRQLVEKDALVLTSKDSQGQNPLFWAIKSEHATIVDFLVQREDLSDFLRDGQGRTALSAACGEGGLQIVEVLLGAKGVHPNLADDDGKTPLCWAAAAGSDGLVKHLISVDADCNAKTHHGWTPLHYAAQGGSEKALRSLLPYSDANAVAADGTTPLVAALRANARSTVQLLLQTDYVSLHEQLRRGDEHMFRRLLDVGYDVNKSDMWGRTALHSAALVESDRLAMAQILISSEPKPNLDVEDINGLTPLRLALQKRRLGLAELLLKNSARTTNIGVKDWLNAYGHNDDHHSIHVVMVKMTGAETKVSCLSSEEFSEELGRSQVSGAALSRRIFVFTKASEIIPHIPGDHHGLRATPALGRLSIQPSNLQSPTGGFQFSVVARFPRFSELIAKLPRSTPRSRRKGTVIMIRWTVTRQHDNATGKSWGTVNHISTLSNGWIPEDGIDFFLQLLEELKQKWIQICDDGEKHLAKSRRTILEKGGRYPRLIQTLLDDAGMWIDLQADLKAQVTTALEFGSKYRGLDVDEDALAKLPEYVHELSDLVGSRLEALDTKSQELIQIEFNLTSIAEAKHSTSTNNSMKRLTWITFIFLPLTFISSLFGMNVDVLDPSPPWWWYLPLAIGTMSLTFGIWIAFKRNHTLEEKLETKFDWLLKSREDSADDGDG